MIFQAGWPGPYRVQYLNWLQLSDDFQRDFHLGSIIDQGQIEAYMKNGVRRLVKPKVEHANPRKIEVKVG